MLLRYHHIIITLIFGIGATSCGITENVPEEMAATEFLQSFSDSTREGRFEISKVQLNLTDFRFEAETPEDREVEIRIEHDHGVIVDLLKSRIDSSLVPDLPTGPFVELEVRLKAESVNGDPTLWVEGSLVDSTGQNLPFILKIHHEFELRLEIEKEHEPFFFEHDFLSQFNISENFSKIFQNIDRSLWSQVEIDETGVIMISRDHNPGIFQKISLKLGDDFKIKIEHD